MDLGADINDVMGYSRAPRISQVRQEVWRRLRALRMADGNPPSQPVIGAWFDRDASTVRYGIAAAEKRVTPGIVDLAA